ncbi:MAG TPA: ThiF family adenylyltransferase, partial [Microbacterium sp.]|nr:ThiF family adenylyltransferase [Microbacterium sp.]
MPLVAPVPALDDEERERYSRTVMVPEIGDEGQRRLRAARVLVIGAGGLGGPTLLGLACAGVGVLGVVDADRVDLGNLQRQFLHRVRDIGRRKTRSAARAVRALNPGVEVREHAVRLTPENAPDLFADYDVVVDGSDNFATRYLVADASAARGIPCVWGSVLRFEGQVAVFWPPHGPGYRDLYPDAPAEAPTCASAGVFGPLCALVGAQLTAEVVKLVTGVGRTLLGRVAVIDALGAEWRSIAIAGPGPEATDATPRDDAQRRGAPAANCTAARS